MTDAPDPQQDAVRRLLADARHDEPTPPQVVDRLESTLVGLRADRAAAADPTPVVDLGARRRRVVAAGVLAAAAVVVAGVAVGQVLPRGGSDSGGVISAESTDDDADSRLGGAEDGGDAAAEPAAPEHLSGKTEAGSALPELSLDAALDDSVLDLRAGSRSRAPLSGADAVFGCDTGVVGRGRRVLVTVEGQPGLVVFRRPAADRQEAAVYVCGDPEPVRTLSLPAP